MSYSRNMPDWQQYNALQSGGSEAGQKSGQNVNSSHLYVPNISPPSLNGLNLSSDCLSKSQNDVINYSQRNYQPPNNTPSGPNSLVEPALTSLVHMSNCVSHYGASSSMNSIMEDSSNVNLRNGSVATLNEEMAHRNQISLNGPVPRVVGPNMNVGNNMGTAGQRIPPSNNVPSSRQGPYVPCKGPCCVSDPNLNYQSWEKFPPYQANNPYRENLRATAYPNETRRYRNDMAYRKDSYPSKDIIPPNSYHVDQRRNFTDYKYCKDTSSVPRNYQPSTVLPNYPISNYGVPSSDYQKYAYTMKDYPRQGAMTSQNSSILKYSEHNVSMQDKFASKQGQYQSGALLQKGLVVPSISSNVSSVQNPYMNPQFSRDYQWENHEKDSSKIQNPVPVHSTYPKYQLYQQKYAMQRYSMENHLRELSRIPGYQSHPKYQECILRYRELLRLQQTVDYQSAIQNTLTSGNTSVPPINLQFDQNGVLINSNYLPGSFPTTHNPRLSVPNPMRLDKEQEENHDMHQIHHLSTRSEQGPPSVQNSENIPRDVQFLNQKTIDNPHCQVAQREEERFESSREEDDKRSKNFANKPVLDVRQFLANWDEAEEEEGANANLPDVVLSNSTPIVVVEYGNLVAQGSEAEQKTETETTTKEFFPKDQAEANLLQECTNDLNQGVIYANKLNIKCVGEGIDGVPTIHIVENPEEYIYTEKAEMEAPGASLPTLTETKECDSSETKESSISHYKKLSAQKDSEPKLQANPQDLSILPLAKTNPETEISSLKKQNSFTNEDNQTSDDISLPDLTTSECTPISTTLNTPTHSDSEECSNQGVDLTTSTNPIELIQNSPMISFTQSPVKIDPYEHLKGENLSLKTNQDPLDFDFQTNNESVIKSQVLDPKKEITEKINPSLENRSKSLEQAKFSQERDSVNKDSAEFSSNMDVFSTDDQDKWCWNSMSLIPGEENEEPKIPVPPVEENELTKIMKDSAPITSMNVHESGEEKSSKVDDIWLDVGYINKGLDLSSDTKTNSEKLYPESDQTIQKKRDVADVSASVTKILKNIKDRQNLNQNSIQESIKRNPKGINIISEEIFNSPWSEKIPNKLYPPFRKMSDSFERQEIEAFAENFNCSHRSRSRSLETNSVRNRSKSAESVKIEEQSRLLMEFKNLKRKRSIDHFEEENKLPKLTVEKEKERKRDDDEVSTKNAEIAPEQSNQKSSIDEKKLNTNEKKMDSDLEIKFRNSFDSSKPLEAFKIEINVSRSEGKAPSQTASQPQKCNESDFNGNKEEPSTCGSITCSGKNSNCQSKVDTKIQNQKSCEDLDNMNFDKIAEKSKIQGYERKESVIEYFGKGQHKKISKLGYSACDTCTSLNYHKLDKDCLCNHLDNRIIKSHESTECLKNPLELNNSQIECLSNRLRSISKSKSSEELKKKSKSQELRKFRKIKYKDKGCFSGFENRADKLNDNLEILACTSDSSAFRNPQTNDLLKDDLSNTSDETKPFVIKNSLLCDPSNFDESFQISQDNRPNLESLELENSLSPKGYLNPLFNSLEDVENLNAVPVYTTKDGKITYSPNPRFTYRTLLIEAQEKENQSVFENSCSTSQDKRSSKSSERRSSSNKCQTDSKPPKKSLAKRFATQELEKSYQRYLSHKERKASLSSNEPMLIKTIKNYNTLNESTSGNEDVDEKLNRDSGKDFEDLHLQIESEIERNCLQEKINQKESNISDSISLAGESNEEIQIDRRNDQVFTQIQSPNRGDVDDNQVVPDSVPKINSTENTQNHLESIENSFTVSGVDQIQNCSVNLDDSVSKIAEIEQEINIENSKNSSENLKWKFVKNHSLNDSPKRRKSTSDIRIQSPVAVLERRKSENYVSKSMEMNSNFLENPHFTETRVSNDNSENQIIYPVENSKIQDNSVEISSSEENWNFVERLEPVERLNSPEMSNSVENVNSEENLTAEANSGENVNCRENLNSEINLNFDEISNSADNLITAEMPNCAENLNSVENLNSAEISSSENLNFVESLNSGEMSNSAENLNSAISLTIVEKPNSPETLNSTITSNTEEISNSVENLNSDLNNVEKSETAENSNPSFSENLNSSTTSNIVESSNSDENINSAENLNSEESSKIQNCEENTKSPNNSNSAENSNSVENLDSEINSNVENSSTVNIKNVTVDNIETDKTVDCSENVKENDLKNSSGSFEENIDKDITIINLEEEEKEIREEPVFSSPARKEVEIEIIEIDDDEVLIVEPKQEISQGTEIFEKVDKIEEIDNKEIIETAIEELKSNDRLEEVITLPSDLEPKSEIPNNVVNKNEIEEVDEADGNKITSSAESSSKNDDLLSNQENKNEEIENFPEFVNLVNESEHNLDFEREVEFLSEIIEEHTSKDCFENESRNFTSGDNFDTTLENQFQEIKYQCSEGDQRSEREFDKTRNQESNEENCEQKNDQVSIQRKEQVSNETNDQESYPRFDEESDKRVDQESNERIDQESSKEVDQESDKINDLDLNQRNDVESCSRNNQETNQRNDQEFYEMNDQEFARNDRELDEIIDQEFDEINYQDFDERNNPKLAQKNDQNEGRNQEDNQESNQNNIQIDENYESDLKDCEREYFETRGLSPSLETVTPTQMLSERNSENPEEILDNTTNEKKIQDRESGIQDESSFQDLPPITEKINESQAVYIDEDSCFEVEPPVLEMQKKLTDFEILNSPKSSDSNQFNMPDVTLEENFDKESELTNFMEEKMVPKLVIRKIETNRNSPTKSRTIDNVESSVQRKIPKMIIRNAKSRPTTPTIEEIPEELTLSNEESNVIKVKIRLDDINKNESCVFSNEENRIPKMKIKLEDKLPKVVIKNLDIRNAQDLQKLVPKVKIKKLKTSKANDLEINDSSSKSTEDVNFEETCKNSLVADSEEAKVKIPKLKIKKDLKHSVSRKRRGSDSSSAENKKSKRSSKEEAKRVDTENSLSSPDSQITSEKVPKVIIKRTSPTAEFKCEVSKDKKNLLDEITLQPQVVLQRSWILDCMAKELKHVNIALKLAIAKNGSKASVRGKSNSSKIRWEQFIRSLKRQKELSKFESNAEINSGKIKRRRKSDVGLRYFDNNSRIYNKKAYKSARESTNSDPNYLNNQSLYFKDLFSEERLKNQQYNTVETWKKFDENMNSESKDLLNSEKCTFSNFGDAEQDINQREIKLDEDEEAKCPLLNTYETDSKTNLNIGFDENKIKTEEVNLSVLDIRPEFSTSLMPNGDEEYLYSEDAIPTQFEFELEIVDSSVDTYDVPMSDIKEFPDSIDSLDVESSSNLLETGSTNSDQLPRLLLPDEDSSCTNNVRDDSCDIKDEIPILNNLINLSDTSQNSKQLCGSSSTEYSDSMSLVQEVMAAKEVLRKYLPKCQDQSTSRPKTLAEKKQGTGFSLEELEKTCLTARNTSEVRSSRSHTKYDKKRPKEGSSSREKHSKSSKTLRLDDDPCKYDQHSTISLRDQKRSSLHSTQAKESNKTKDSEIRSKSAESNLKRSRSKSDARCQKSRESSKDGRVSSKDGRTSSRDGKTSSKDGRISSKDGRESSKDRRESSKDRRESSRDARNGDDSKIKSYKIPKISKSKESSGIVTEVKLKEEMPILEPEGGVNLDLNSDLEASLSPPVITNQDDVEILEEESKVFDARGVKEEKVSWNMMKNTQVVPGGTLADAVQNWVFHEKATIKHRRYCVLCERWFPSVIRHRRHLSGYQHRHTELTQRRTIHTLFMLFTGNPCPRLLPADVLRSDCSLGEPTPLQIAVQNVALGYDKAPEKPKRKDEEDKQ